MTSPRRSHPAYALCAYAEPLAEGRRVVVVGDSSLDLGGTLMSAGARVVHVYDPNAERARANAQSERGVSVRELAADGFDVRDGAFDLAIVPDLGTFRDPGALLTRLRRLLAVGGALLVGANNPAASPGKSEGARTIEYAELYDLVSIEFASVRMIGQVPFHGVTLAELGETNDEPEVSVDTQLAPEGRVPEMFIALAGQDDVRLAPYALVELAPPVREAAKPADDRVLRAALAEAVLRADLLAAQLAEARGAMQQASADAETARGRRVGELEGQIAALQAHIASLEARGGEHYARAERFAQEVNALEAEVIRQRRRALELEEQVTDYKRMRAHSDVELMATRAGMSDLEERLALVTADLETAHAVSEVPQVDPAAIAALAERAALAEDAELAVQKLQHELTGISDVHAQELAQIETLLRDRARTIKELEHELLRRERLVKELVRALEERDFADAAAADRHQPVTLEKPSPAPVEPVARAVDHAALYEARHENQALRDRLDALALEVARREADLQAQAWRVTELETKAQIQVSKGDTGAATASDDVERRLAGATNEIDALRQALTQEHEARARAESGDLLAKAQAELARQATLIEQLSRELDARDRARAHADAQS